MSPVRNMQAVSDGIENSSTQFAHPNKPGSQLRGASDEAPRNPHKPKPLSLGFRVSPFTKTPQTSKLGCLNFSFEKPLSNQPSPLQACMPVGGECCFILELGASFGSKNPPVSALDCQIYG